MNTCKSCGQARKLVKAHAIPEAFFRELNNDGMAPIVITNRPGEFSKRAPIGIYDKTILCSDCEGLFGTIDSYAIDVLLKRFSDLFNPYPAIGKPIAHLSTQADKFRILQFLVAVLWRASVSSQRFYSRVDLGSHLPAAYSAIRVLPEKVSAIFDAVLSKWKDGSDEIPTTAMLDPAPERWNGINAYRIYLGKLVAYAKVDRRPFPEDLRASSLRGAEQLAVVERNMEKSKDLRVMRNAARKSLSNCKSRES